MPTAIVWMFGGMIVSKTSATFWDHASRGDPFIFKGFNLSKKDCGPISKDQFASNTSGNEAVKLVH
jgi:hypothetical protein